MKQKVLWIEKSNSNTRDKTCKTIYDGLMPTHVWTLKQFDKVKEPILPIIPKHLINVFLEDKIHDWNIRNGFFHYYSRVCEGNVWLLLEFR